MLDDMRALRDAVRDYRLAATAAGLDWPDYGESPAGQPPAQVSRVFGVDHIAEQLTWLHAVPTAVRVRTRTAAGKADPPTRLG